MVKKTLINPNIAILYQISDGLKNWSGILMDFAEADSFFSLPAASRFSACSLKAVHTFFSTPSIQSTNKFHFSLCAV